MTSPHISNRLFLGILSRHWAFLFLFILGLFACLILLCSTRAIVGGPTPVPAEVLGVRALATSLSEYKNVHGGIPFAKTDFEALSTLQDAWKRNYKAALAEAHAHKHKIAGSISFEDILYYGEYLNKPLSKEAVSENGLIYIWRRPIEIMPHAAMFYFEGIDRNMHITHLQFAVGLDGIYVPEYARAPERKIQEAIPGK